MASPPTPPPPLVHLQRCRVSFSAGVSDPTSLWLDPAAGKIIGLQDVFRNMSRGVVELDLEGDVLAPGFIDVQVNGGYGHDLGRLPDEQAFPTEQAQAGEYLRRLTVVAERIVETGVTSFLPTVMTQPADVYPRLLPLLAPRAFASGASTLGFHAEGPFLSPARAGCHPPADLLACTAGMRTVEEVYGAQVLAQDGVKLFTLAPEVAGVLPAVPTLKARGAVVSIGHSSATNVEAMAAVLAGATMVTHLYNAMPPLNHRNPGVIGLLSAADSLPSSAVDLLKSLQSSGADAEAVSEALVQSALDAAQDLSPVPEAEADEGDDDTPNLKEGWEAFKRPFWGVIADGCHVHPTALKMAYHSHPDGCVLTTDCLHLMDPHAQDGTHAFRPGTDVVRKGNKVTLEGTATLVGSVVDMQTSVRNLSAFAGVPLHKAIACATEHPARMLGGDVVLRKGRLERGFDADLVVLDKQGRVRMTWVAGVCVWTRPD